MIWLGCICSVFLIRSCVVIWLCFLMFDGWVFSCIMCFWCSCSLVVFLIVMMCLLVGMNDDMMLSVVVLFEFVLLLIRMFSCLCM